MTLIPTLLIMTKITLPRRCRPLEYNSRMRGVWYEFESSCATF